MNSKPCLPKIIVYEIQNTLKISVSENCNLLSSEQFVTYCLEVCYMCFMTLLCCLLFSSFFLSSLFFFFLFFSYAVHKISIIPSLSPNNFFLLFFFFSLLNFPIVTFPPFVQTYVSWQRFFFNSINRSFTWAPSIQFSSDFVINNVMLFDLAFTFKPRTLVQNFKTYSIYICINLTIVVTFIHNIFAFVFI